MLSQIVYMPVSSVDLGAKLHGQYQKYGVE